MSKAIKFSEPKWRKLYDILKNDYPLSVLLIRSRMRAVLGFTVRTHTTYTHQRGTENHICLDFFDEPKRLMFLLKYGEYL